MNSENTSNSEDLKSKENNNSYSNVSVYLKLLVKFLEKQSYLLSLISMMV